MPKLFLPLGKTLPYMLWRLDSRAAVTTIIRTICGLPSQMIREDVVVTTSGVCSTNAARVLKIS
jgi:2,3-dihydroxybenzoate decarboxylase